MYYHLLKMFINMNHKLENLKLDPPKLDPQIFGNLVGFHSSQDKKGLIILYMVL